MWVLLKALPPESAFIGAVTEQHPPEPEKPPALSVAQFHQQWIETA